MIYQFAAFWCDLILVSPSEDVCSMLSDFFPPVFTFAPYEPRAVVLNLWDMTFLEVTYQISCISDSYIMIHNCSKTTL